MTTPKKFRQNPGLSAIAGTQPKLAVIEIQGGVWKCAPVSERPEIVLVDWHVFEVKLPSRAERTRHFAGQNITDREGRTSSAIETFDAATSRGTTESGRVYELREVLVFLEMANTRGVDGKALIQCPMSWTSQLKSKI